MVLYVASPQTMTNPETQEGLITTNFDLHAPHTVQPAEPLNMALSGRRKLEQQGQRNNMLTPQVDVQGGEAGTPA